MTEHDTWTVKAALDWTSGYLERKGDENPRLSAEWLLSEALGMRRIDLYAGARLVPASASVMFENGVLSVSLAGENKGVAPIHLPYEAVYAFKSADGQTVAEHVSASDPTTWLPGPFSLADDLTPPLGFAEGRLTLVLRLRHTGGKFRDFRFAARERDETGALILVRN